jgi:zeaxanthin glucosyltransferase
VTAIAAALAPLDVDVAMAIGSNSPASIGNVPGHWFLAPAIAQASLMANAALVIHHGGNNSVQEALAYRVHQIVMPFSTDQPAIGADLERVGLGRCFDPNAIDVIALRHYVESALVLQRDVPGTLNAMGEP